MRKQNQMRAAMRLFDSFANSDSFKNKPVLLVLDKLDIFEEKLLYSPISGHFTEFNGSDTTLCAATGYFGCLFQQINRTQDREIGIHYTNTTDTISIKSMMASIAQMAMRQKMRRRGLY